MSKQSSLANTTQQTVALAALAGVTQAPEDGSQFTVIPAPGASIPFKPLQVPTCTYPHPIIHIHTLKNKNKSVSKDEFR